MTVELLALPDLAGRLAVPVNRVHQYLRDGQLVAVRPDGGPRSVPALFVQDGAIVKALPSVITVLRDASFSDEEIVEWLHRVDDSLPGSPIEALRHGTTTEAALEQLRADLGSRLTHHTLDCGHVVYWEVFDEVVAELRAFLLDA